ncbi:hypothetical protein GSI_08356 [Ganoderma sinense ZZ0214-1]|uniref:Uncharacterized protein n=1 Tax=Ganoderma sinense ZZ0214-1 TaxID=1077348 RepID=A0A2G8S7M1_9APHY|nr:hypothetical protein GSI_08356 [Ganoderma sinense ZZ0214-1]
MSRPRAYALQQLNALPSWSPFLKLHLGIRNQIPEWIQAAFSHVVLNIPLEEITINDVLCIGGPAYWAIVQAKTKILDHRRLLVFDWPEAVHSPTCELSTSCGLTWKSEWWYTFVKCVLHPDNKYSPEEALKEVELTKTDYMEKECKELTIQAVKDDGGLDQSEEIIEEALGALRQFLQL